MNAPALYEISVKALVLREGRVLGLKRYSHHGDQFWDVPGGRLQAGDSLELALRRELLQELGYSGPLRSMQLIDSGLWSEDSYPGPDKLLLYYRVELDPQPLVLSDEHTGASWLDQEALARGGGDPAVRLEPELERLLRRLLRAEAWRAELRSSRR